MIHILQAIEFASSVFYPSATAVGHIASDLLFDSGVGPDGQPHEGSTIEPESRWYQDLEREKDAERAFNERHYAPMGPEYLD